jgi:hypothetical protein
VQAPAAPPAIKAESGSALAVLKRYYALIERGDYAGAHRLREPNPRGASAAAFAAGFADYAEYRGAVSSASEPVSSGGWDYVEVAVQIIGRTKAGRPFSSAGTVTLRRRSGSTQWRISPR